jgi:hypothetical protein
MERYKNGKIYKIVDNTNGNVYIGSTCEPTLAKRLAKHRGHYKEYLKGGYNFVTSFKILENNDYSIVLLEEFPCETKDQLLARERYYIENNECVNKVVPTRTIKEYYQDNKDKLIDYQKQWREDNKDKLIDYQKQWREDNKDKLIDYQKQWREDNKDKRIDYQKEYYEQNKNKIIDYKKEKITCECGIICRRDSLNDHLKTNKHKKKSLKQLKVTSNDILNAEPL